MKNQEKNKFDNLNQTSYLLRVNLNRLNFDVCSIEINSCIIWHAIYNDTVIGTITFRTDKNDFTFCNIRLYKYLKSKNSEKFSDFIMSDYFEYDDKEKPVKFNFDKFDKFFNSIAEIFQNDETIQSNDKCFNNVEDSISRLTEYCDEFDEQFSKNIFVLDIRNLLNENKRLNEILSKKQY